jgi:hypothetical protein
MNNPTGFTLSFPKLQDAPKAPGPADWSLATKTLLYRMAIGIVWADFAMSPRAERALHRLAGELALPSALADERHHGPPLPEDVDPMRVPPSLAQAFLGLLRRVAIVDGHLRGARAACLALIEDMLGADHDAAQVAPGLRQAVLRERPRKVVASAA